MLKRIKFPIHGLLVCGLLFGLAGFVQVEAQTTAKASYNKTTQLLTLDTAAPFSYLFELDIRPMNFATKAKADEFFSNWTTELVSFQVDFDKKKADVLLKTRMKPEWKATEWNEYLAQLPKQ